MESGSKPSRVGFVREVWFIPRKVKRVALLLLVAVILFFTVSRKDFVMDLTDITSTVILYNEQPVKLENEKKSGITK